MKYFTIKPPESLAEYVRYFWVLEGEASPDKAYIHRSMADGCAELIFHYNGIFDELIEDVAGKSFSSGTRRPISSVQTLFDKAELWDIWRLPIPVAVSQLFSLQGTETQEIK